MKTGKIAQRLCENAPMSHFNWDDLQFFLAVARARAVSRAAKTLGVDHATVIRRIDQLERSLSAKLFQRDPRGYALTHSGERLFASAQTIESEAQRAALNVTGCDPAVSGTVRISSLEGFGNFFLAERLPRFAAAHADLSIELIAIQQLVALSRRDADIAITLQPPESGHFVNELLTEYTLYVYGTKRFLERSPPITSREKLRDSPFAGYIDDLVFMRDLDYLGDIGYPKRPQLQSSSLHAQLEATLAGFGLCVLPAFVAARHESLVAILPLEVNLRRRYWLVTHAETTNTPRIRAVSRFVRDEVDAAQPLFLGVK